MAVTEAPRYDVAIAGAGLAGSALAVLLARGGARVALLDPGRFPRDKLCGEFLSPECWGVLGRLGVAGAVERSGYRPIRRVRLSTPAGRVLEAEVVGPGEPAGIGLGRSTLDAILLDAARGAGVDVFEATRVGGPILDDAGRVAGLAARGAGPDPVLVPAKVTVAADGRHSALVRQAATTRGRSWFRPRLFGLKRHLDASDPAAGADEPGVVGLHLIRGGYGGTCQVDGGATNLCALLPESAARARRGDLDRVAAEVLGANPRLARLMAGAAPVSPWKAVAGVRVQVSTPTRPGLLLAGDAQGTVDPLGGQGMTMALLGAEVLAPFVVQALESGRGGADAPLQRACQAAWHARFDRRVRLCRLLHHTLIRPGVVDLGSILRPFGASILAAGFRRTRDCEWAPA